MSSGRIIQIIGAVIDVEHSEGRFYTRVRA